MLRLYTMYVWYLSNYYRRLPSTLQFIALVIIEGSN